MSDTKGVLVFRVAEHLSREQHERVAALLDPVAKAIGVPGMILGPGCEVELRQGYGAELKRIGDLLEQLVDRGKAHATQG